MNILIIEDENPNFKLLESYIKEAHPSWIVDGPLKSIDSVKIYFNSGGNPDLIITDVLLLDGVVFEAFDYIKTASRIIFTTAYSQYALKAFAYNSVHYLLKPIVPDELEAAIQKALAMGPRMVDDIKDCTIDNPNNYRKRFLINSKNGAKILSVLEIDYITYDSTLLKVFTKDGKSAVINCTLEQCEEQLDPSMFFRISRNSMININAISSINHGWPRRLYVRLKEYPDIKFEVSRRRISDFKKWLESR